MQNTHVILDLKIILFPSSNSENAKRGLSLVLCRTNSIFTIPWNKLSNKKTISVNLWTLRCTIVTFTLYQLT